MITVNNNIENITKINFTTQNQKLRFFSKLDIESKLKVFESQKKIFHRLKSHHSDVNNSVLTYSSFLLAIDEILSKIEKVNYRAIEYRSKNLKLNLKREKLLENWAIVKTLKNDEKYSFREISKYFEKYHRFEVSYSKIYQLWNEIENKKGKSNEQ